MQSFLATPCRILPCQTAFKLLGTLILCLHKSKQSFLLFSQSTDQTWLLAATSEGCLPWSNLPQISTLWRCCLPCQPCIPLKDGEDTQPFLKLGRRNRRIIPAFQKNVLRDFLQLHKAHLHTENCGAERLMQLCAASAPDQCYSRSSTGEATAKSILNLAHMKMASHTVVNKRQIRGITGVQTVIMKVSSGHMSCICTHSYLIAL